jgi:hypothetical protein
MRPKITVTESDDQPNERLLSVSEFAAAVGADEQSIRNWYRAGVLPIVRGPSRQSRVKIRERNVEYVRTMRDAWGYRWVSVAQGMLLAMADLTEQERDRG